MKRYNSGHYRLEWMLVEATSANAPPKQGMKLFNWVHRRRNRGSRGHRPAIARDVSRPPQSCQSSYAPGVHLDTEPMQGLTWYNGAFIILKGTRECVGNACHCCQDLNGQHNILHCWWAPPPWYLIKNVGYFLLKTAHHPFWYLTMSVHAQILTCCYNKSGFLSDHHRPRSGCVKCLDQDLAIVRFLYKQVIGALDSYELEECTVNVVILGAVNDTIIFTRSLGASICDGPLSIFSDSPPLIVLKIR